MTIATIKTAIKKLFDDSGKFGTVTTEVHERIDNSKSNAIQMFHDSGSDEISPMGAVTRTSILNLYLIVQRPALYGDDKVQTETDTALEDLLDALYGDITLGDTVIMCLPQSWSIDYEKLTDPVGNITTQRMVATVRVSVMYRV